MDLYEIPGCKHLVQPKKPFDDFIFRIDDLAGLSNKAAIKNNFTFLLMPCMGILIPYSKHFHFSIIGAKNLSKFGFSSTVDKPKNILTNLFY